jgi:hypothetical protein
MLSFIIWKIGPDDDDVTESRVTVWRHKRVEDRRRSGVTRRRVVNGDAVKWCKME